MQLPKVQAHEIVSAKLVISIIEAQADSLFHQKCVSEQKLNE